MTRLVSRGKSAWPVLVVPLLLASGAAAATFSVTPGAAGNTYTGSITLQAGGLSTGGTVLVRKYLDANGNGKIDAGDILYQEFELTDGQASLFHDGTMLVTNLDVPGDLDTIPGRITATFGLAAGGFEQTIVGNYLFKLSSPSGAFAPLTNSFAVTNSPFAQSVTGVVKASGTNLPGAVVLLFQPSNGNNMNPQAGALVDNSGKYTLSAPAGDYVLTALKNGFIARAELYGSDVRRLESGRLDFASGDQCAKWHVPIHRSRRERLDAVLSDFGWTLNWKQSILSSLALSDGTRTRDSVADSPPQAPANFKTGSKARSDRLAPRRWRNGPTRRHSGGRAYV